MAISVSNISAGTLDADTVSPAEFRNAMREVASGVSIISSGRSGRARGLTATAFASLSAEPPAVLVCVNRDSECHRTILETGAFCLNILKAEDEALAHRFAGRGGIRGHERFLEGNWMTLATGSPVLSHALVAFDCLLRESVASHTHMIFIGDVAAISSAGSGSALVYRAGAFSAIG
ncbi:MAG: flavin reductase family protein [Pseudochelatococcus sp.]|jgi:flavin reductase (DIM6/NTAB) family NADH-FMN oxidoreductase RutF|uniref:flavin reductase family protein n=1 Tax=Pseudochelatococcus sp. TaxID=2020869 RepID=UPI003D94E07F